MDVRRDAKGCRRRQGHPLWRPRYWPGAAPFDRLHHTGTEGTETHGENNTFVVLFAVLWPLCLCGESAPQMIRPTFPNSIIHRRTGRYSTEDRITFAACPFPRSCPIATTVAAPPSWTVKDAEKLYNMSGWGLGYFRVSPEGHVTVHPDAN